MNECQLRTFPRFRPIKYDILLSLRSFSSFLGFSLSLSLLRELSLELFASLFSLSECKLLLELEPLSKDGRPKLRTDDFLCADPGTEEDEKLVSLVGEKLLGARRRVPPVVEVDWVGDEDDGRTPEGGNCIDCEEERRKNGIDDGVRRLVDGPRRIDDEGLRGALLGRGGIEAVKLVLALEAVSDRLGTNRSGVFDVVIGRGAGAATVARLEFIDNWEAREVADAMAATFTGDQSSIDCLGVAVG